MKTLALRFRNLIPLLLFAVVVALLLAACSERHNRRRSLPAPAISKNAARALQTEPDVSPEALKDSVHAALDCSECHVRAAGDDATHGEVYAKESSRCVTCHKEATESHEASIHGTALEAGNKGAARCVNCHGAHDIRKVSDPGSRVYARNLPFTCGKCHRNPEVAHHLGIADASGAAQYFESIHGRALLIKGLVVAPTCVDCHGHSHKILKADNPKSTVSRARLVDTCGQCHTGVVDEFETSIHGEAARRGDPKAPICVDCHTAHSITDPGKEYALSSDKICGRCHEDRLRRYLMTYHGRAHDLGDANVAACFDCHGSHGIRPVSDPASTLSTQNRVATCSQCHEGANENFAGFYAHGDYHDRTNYPILYWSYIGMTTLLLGTFGFFGLHTLLWFARGLREYFRDPKAFKEAKSRARQEKGVKLYRRFRAVDRVCHFLLINSFLLLVATGMPLKFHNSDWAKTVFNALGGPGAGAGLHRIGAIMTGIYMAIHLASMISLASGSRERYRDANGRFGVRGLLRMTFGPDSPLPNFKDFRDGIGHFRYFFGLGPRPRFDRFTYWEKFDYMAVFWGVTVIGLSGLVMWFPVAVTRVFPGWVVNIAHVIHSDEALLAACFIFTVHFFNSHFRPDKFPMDMVMFSGHVTEDELKHERPAMYERLAASGELAKLQVQSDFSAWKPIMAPLGAIFVIVGLLLAIAIFYALGHNLIGG